MLIAESDPSHANWIEEVCRESAKATIGNVPLAAFIADSYQRAIEHMHALSVNGQYPHFLIASSDLPSPVQVHSNEGAFGFHLIEFYNAHVLSHVGRRYATTLLLGSDEVSMQRAIRERIPYLVKDSSRKAELANHMRQHFPMLVRQDIMSQVLH
jgi:hypothetical protein